MAELFEPPKPPEPFKPPAELASTTGPTTASAMGAAQDQAISAQAAKAPTTINPEMASMQQSILQQPSSEAQSAAATSAAAGDGPFTLENKTFDPILSEVDASKETVQGQLQNIFAEGNPLLVQARNRAASAAAGRGMQNSSLAAGAGESALIGQALPIAQQDAATYGNRALANNATQNQYRLAEQAHAQRLDEAKAAGNINAYLTELSAGYERDLATLQGQITKDIHILDAANELVKLATQGDIDSRLMLEKYGFDSSLSAQENLHKLEQLALQGDVNAKLQLQQFTYDSILKDKDANLAITLEDKRIQAVQNNIMLEYEQRGLLSAQEAEAEMARLNQQHTNTLEQIAAQAEAGGTQEDKARSAALQAQYLTAVAARQAAASAEMTEVYSTPKLSATQQNVAAANIKARMEQDLAALAAYYQSSPLWPTDAPVTPPAATLPPAPGVPASTAPAPGNIFDQIGTATNIRGATVTR